MLLGIRYWRVFRLQVKFSGESIQAAVARMVSDTFLRGRTRTATLTSRMSRMTATRTLTGLTTIRTRTGAGLWRWQTHFIPRIMRGLFFESHLFAIRPFVFLSVQDVPIFQYIFCFLISCIPMRVGGKTSEGRASAKPFEDRVVFVRERDDLL